jgi:ribosomal protein S14
MQSFLPFFGYCRSAMRENIQKGDLASGGFPGFRGGEV